MDVTVVVATFGDESWGDLARSRAIPSAQAETPRVVHVHADTLHDARNAGLATVETEWVCFLDADDELLPGYVMAMERGTADVRAPAVAYVRGQVAGQRPVARVPRVAGHRHPRCEAGCLLDGNWLVVGSLARTDLVRSVGGWRDFAWSEDWDLWLRCYLAGASIEAVPRAVYRAFVRAQSRNRGQSQETRNEAHDAIAAANGIPGRPAARG